MTNALWYLTRGSGLVSLIMLTVVVVLGVVVRSGRELSGLPRFTVAAVHRNASLLAVAFLSLHVITLLADPYAQLSLVNVILPFTATYRPFWSGLGALTLDLIIALVLTGLLRHRIGVKMFRAVHWLAYLAWPVALAHGLGTGTDNATWWLRGTAVVCAAAVGLTVVWRLSAGFAWGARVRQPLLYPVPPPLAVGRPAPTPAGREPAYRAEHPPTSSLPRRPGQR